MKHVSGPTCLFLQLNTFCIAKIGISGGCKQPGLWLQFSGASFHVVKVCLVIVPAVLMQPFVKVTPKGKAILSMRKKRKQNL